MIDHHTDKQNNLTMPLYGSQSYQGICGIYVFIKEEKDPLFRLMSGGAHTFFDVPVCMFQF